VGGQVYRFSDDEFMLVQTGSLSGVEQINEVISQGIHASNGEVIHLTASVGVTLVQSTDTVDSVLQKADAAMYIAKSNGGDPGFQYDGYSDKGI
ncbi:MAG: diguanylate cyclase, partial [Exiguobacterium sp.]|nr:diguanylate cyclase [Exiguobacterium sp.]